ncbi:MAG: aryl-sulfate sulfotransferase [Bacteroidales bacterium]|nr:aryl-sulfate sulfotransferase [Bacteroidales bacterium]
MRKLLFAVAALLLLNSMEAQNPTVGLQYQTGNEYPGYTLFTPNLNNHVYLINNCGEKVHEWVFTEPPALTCYLLKNGNLLRAGREALEIRDWDNHVVWSFLLSKLNLNQHHDIEPLPNGNILCIVGDQYSAKEMLAMGKDSALVVKNCKLSKIIELKPVGDSSATVVWEWKFVDHFIQDYDSTRPNYGAVQNHPELIDLNFDNQRSSDYTHVNSVDYNAELDQILISARHLSEIYIIDHSTTTAEAAGHTGGNSGHGGDILWRWGNPQVYRRGDATDQKLFLQHDAQWVPAGSLDAGKISVFNNGGDGTGTFSSVDLIAPVRVQGQYTILTKSFSPLDFDWSWHGSVYGRVANEGSMSSMQSLPNGNFMICETSIGRISEFSKAGELLWTYVNPSGITMAAQYEEPVQNLIFRAEKYPLDYPGFSGHELASLGLIEDVNSVSESCVQGVGIAAVTKEIPTVLNPVQNGVIRFSANIADAEVLVSDVMGRTIYHHPSFSGNQIQLPLTPGLYIMNVRKGRNLKRYKFISE